MKYKIVETSSGEQKIITASNWKAAHGMAEKWMLAGDWGDEPSYVDYALHLLGEDEDEIESKFGRVAVNTDPEPECPNNKAHEWNSPYELVGGLKENPGEWSIENGRFKFVAVCIHCGCYKKTFTASLDGQFPEVPEHSKYEAADERSEAWVEENKNP
ncbi:MAG: hypothetical protein QM813_03130 [Verrucomicrobiota bacterium]